MITMLQAIDYTRMLLDESGYEIKVVSAEAYLNEWCEGDVLIDVEFILDGTTYFMTTWLQADGTIYGEW